MSFVVSFDNGGAEAGWRDEVVNHDSVWMFDCVERGHGASKGMAKNVHFLDFQRLSPEFDFVSDKILSFVRIFGFKFTALG